MDPNKLVNERKSQRKGGKEISDDKQARFDLQTWKEFGRACGLRKSVIDDVSANAVEEGISPWSRMEEITGVTLPYTVAARRVGSYNLLDLLFRRKLANDPLLEAFADVCDMARSEDRPPAMIFKFAKAGSSLPAAKLVIAEYEYDHDYRWAKSALIVPSEDSLETPEAVVGLYKDWLADMQEACSFGE